MEIKHAQAGTLESGDILIRIYPAEGNGLEINLDSIRNSAIKSS